MPRCASRRDRDLCEHARSFATRLNLRAAPTALPRGSPRPHGFAGFFGRKRNVSCNFLPKPLNRAFWVSRPQSLIALFSFPRLTWQSGSQPCRFEAFSFCIELRSLFCLFAPFDFTTFRACTGRCSRFQPRFFSASPAFCDFLHPGLGERCAVEPTIDESRSPRLKAAPGGQM